MRNTAAKQINVRIKTKYSANLSNKSHFIIYDITWGGRQHSKWYRKPSDGHILLDITYLPHKWLLTDLLKV